MNQESVQICAETIRKHSRSFSLAARLLPQPERDEAFALYHWCRRADDAIDLCEGDQTHALVELQQELDRLYSQERIDDPGLSAMQFIVHERNIPRHYPNELLAGMAMDVQDYRYATMNDLYLYCYRVAGTVGLMMTHVLGVRDRDAMRRAAHMGMAMQITNICRDVYEDWGRGRIYLPEQLLIKHGIGHLSRHLGEPLPREYRRPLGDAVRELLGEASKLYASGDQGVPSLTQNAALGIRTARNVYSAIGSEIARRDYDVFAGRAYVPRHRKSLLVARALARTVITHHPSRNDLAQRVANHDIVRFPNDVLPLPDDSIVRVQRKFLPRPEAAPRGKHRHA